MRQLATCEPTELRDRDLYHLADLVLCKHTHRGQVSQEKDLIRAWKKKIDKSTSERRHASKHSDDPYEDSGQSVQPKNVLAKREDQKIVEVFTNEIRQLKLALETARIGEHNAELKLVIAEKNLKTRIRASQITHDKSQADVRDLQELVACRDNSPENQNQEIARLEATNNAIQMELASLRETYDDRLEVSESQIQRDKITITKMAERCQGDRDAAQNEQAATLAELAKAQLSISKMKTKSHMIAFVQQARVAIARQRHQTLQADRETLIEQNAVLQNEIIEMSRFVSPAKIRHLKSGLCAVLVGSPLKLHVQRIVGAIPLKEVKSENTHELVRDDQAVRIPSFPRIEASEVLPTSTERLIACC